MFLDFVGHPYPINLHPHELVIKIWINIDMKCVTNQASITLKKLYSQRKVKFWFSTNTDPPRIKNELTVDVYTLPISFGPFFLLFLHQFLVWSGEHSVTPFSHFLHSPVEAASLQLWVDCQKFVLTNYKPLSIVKKKTKQLFNIHSISLKIYQQHICSWGTSFTWAAFPNDKEIGWAKLLSYQHHVPDLFLEGITLQLNKH